MWELQKHYCTTLLLASPSCFVRAVVLSSVDGLLRPRPRHGLVPGLLPHGHRAARQRWPQSDRARDDQARLAAAAATVGPVPFPRLALEDRPDEGHRPCHTGRDPVVVGLDRPCTRHSAGSYSKIVVPRWLPRSALEDSGLSQTSGYCWRTLSLYLSAA